MSKNKLKFVIFALSFFNFLFIYNSKVNATNNINFEITSVDNLIYGDKLKNGIIKGESEVEGVYSFCNPEYVLQEVGNISVDVCFFPKDLDKSYSKSINVYVNKRKISIVFDTPIYKQYDGSSKINLPEYSFNGIINNEVVIDGELSGEFVASYVGEDIGITLSGLEIVGEKSNNYYLDFLEHSGRIYPLVLEKSGENATSIILDNNVYVDINYTLRVVKKELNGSVNNKYSSFLGFKYDVYSHNNEKIDVDGSFKVLMNIDDVLMRKERLKLFEFTKDGEYKDLDYNYKDGKISFTIASDSTLVLSIRDIEYNLIAMFGGILLFSLVFVIVYRVRNSKIKEYKKY